MPELKREQQDEIDSLKDSEIRLQTEIQELQLLVQTYEHGTLGMLMRVCQRLERLTVEVSKAGLSVVTTKFIPAKFKPHTKRVLKTFLPIWVRQKLNAMINRNQGRVDHFQVVNEVDGILEVQADLLFIIGCREGESKRYRVHNICDYANSKGYRCLTINLEQSPQLQKAKLKLGVLVIFRAETHRVLKNVITNAKKQGVKVVFDVDDLVFEEKTIPFVRALKHFNAKEKENYLAGVRNYRKTLELADYATCTTPFLADQIRATGKEARVYPNSINPRQLEKAESILYDRAAHPHTANESLVIGYFSGSKTHEDDFKAAQGALLRILKEFPQIRLKIVGHLDMEPQWASFSGRIERVPFLPYREMLDVLGSIDINIAPLEIGNPYCESKSQLKIFEAGLVEVPTVASAISSYALAVDHGKDGYLAGTEEEWYRSLRNLVENTDLRRQVGKAARARALQQFSIETVGPQALEALGLKMDTHKLQTHLPEGKLRISWIVPGFVKESGGHRNIIRTAYHLSRFGHHVEIYYTNTELPSQELYRLTQKHFYPINANIHKYEDVIAACDVLFATHWSTVEIAMKHRKAAGRVFYFVQDFEPMFSPMGSEYILAENTYRLGLYHITSGPWCEHFLRESYGAKADHFKFPVDRKTYYPRERQKKNPNILFFGRPEMPRRCFELGVKILEQFQRIQPDVEIIVFGSKQVNPKTLPFKATVRAVVPTLEDLAQMYSDADLGLVFSTTNPSLVPYEMMACGLPVVDLKRPFSEVNYGNRSDIALLGDPDPETMARQMSELMMNPEERAARKVRGLELVKQFPGEEETASRIESLIVTEFFKGSIPSSKDTPKTVPVLR